MWRGEGNAVVGAEEAIPQGDGPRAEVTPGSLAIAEPGVTVMHVAEPERERLREQAAQLGGRSSLLH
ncbi:MAG: hypothetical protein J0I50_07420, partial [Microbacterium sp.]|nr:hypothetical protein [Microbacterium sp.]